MSKQDYFEELVKLGEDAEDLRHMSKEQLKIIYEDYVSPDFVNETEEEYWEHTNFDD